MRQGCISLGDVRCDGCKRIVAHGERYLVVKEDGNKEGKEGQQLQYCVDCCLDKGYAHYRQEKNEKILTFFTGEY